MRLATALVLMILGICGLAFGEHKDRWIVVEPGLSPQPVDTAAWHSQGLRTTAETWHPMLPPATSLRMISDGGERPLGALLQGAAPSPSLVLRAEWLSPGPNVVVFDSAPVLQQMQRTSTLITFLTHHGLLDALRARLDSGKSGEPFRHRALWHHKAVVQVGTAPGQRAWQPTGGELEIVPLSNPCLASAGYLVPFRVLARGSPVAGRHVAAVSRAGQLRVIEGVTDEKGEVRLTLGALGRWVVFAASLELGNGDVDVVTHEASLSFVRH